MKATVLVDSREKRNLHLLKRLTELNIPFRTVTLKYGDYSFEWNGKSYQNEVVVERKNSITELCGNFAKGKTRFQKEFERAYADKCKVFLMVEDGSWEKIDNWEYRSRFPPGELKSRIKTWCNKFQLDLKFVEKDQACDFILQSFREFCKHQIK